MHTIFEGVAPRLLKELLVTFINIKKYFTLSELNQSLASHHYGYSELDTKPNTITGSTMEYHIKQKASQMKALIRLFPFIMGGFVPEGDEHWGLLLTLWDICTMVTAFVVTEADASDLAWKVELLLETYVQLYPNSPYVPKMHYLLHLPDELLRFGPPRNTWCMRFESKNKELKGFTSNCFKNVPYSVSVRHQQRYCHLLAVRPGQEMSNFLYKGDEVSSGKSVILDNDLVAPVTQLCGLDHPQLPLVAYRLVSLTFTTSLYQCIHF
ncbi:uncharacterized protein LOC135331689 [Halichondria panicea]|uniref:uncharacterized protein LOC135331689 n=1 Tax=Halichondria panicea TaxID=6063 RepID=UPI00312BAAD2